MIGCSAFVIVTTTQQTPGVFSRTSPATSGKGLLKQEKIKKKTRRLLNTKDTWWVFFFYPFIVAVN